MPAVYTPLSAFECQCLCLPRRSRFVPFRWIVLALGLDHVYGNLFFPFPTFFFCFLFFSRRREQRECILRIPRCLRIGRIAEPFSFYSSPLPPAAITHARRPVWLLADAAPPMSSPLCNDSEGDGDNECFDTATVSCSLYLLRSFSSSVSFFFCTFLFFKGVSRTLKTALETRRFLFPFHKRVDERRPASSTETSVGGFFFDHSHPLFPAMVNENLGEGTILRMIRQYGYFIVFFLFYFRSSDVRV